jgi:hypothetical protein
VTFWKRQKMEIIKLLIVFRDKGEGRYELAEQIILKTMKLLSILPKLFMYVFITVKNP